MSTRSCGREKDGAKLEDRYDRQRFLLGAEGMSRLRDTHVALYGLGGSGASIALQLAYLGVGRLTIVDPDTVESSNLNRQVLYGYEDVGRLKIDAARDRLQAVDSDVEVVAKMRHTAESLPERIQEYSLVIDATDEYRFKVALDRACRAAGVPMIHTSAIGLRGTVVTFSDQQSSYEIFFELPTRGRSLNHVSDDEIESRRKRVIRAMVGELYGDELTDHVIAGRVDYQTFVAAPSVAAGVVTSEVIRLIMGQSPLYGPGNPFHFDLATGYFTTGVCQ
mgnify:CR=1 FL=1